MPSLDERQTRALERIADVLERVHAPKEDSVEALFAKLEARLGNPVKKVDAAKWAKAFKAVDKARKALT